MKVNSMHDATNDGINLKITIKYVHTKVIPQNEHYCNTNSLNLFIQS